MDPTGPSQPPLDEAYHTPSNPTTKTPSEQHHPSQSSPSSTTETRQAHDISIPSTHTNEPTPSALGYAGTGPDKGEAVGAAADPLDGEQMRMPGEGRVYEAQLEKGKVAGFGEEESLTSGLERKKEEQKGMREEVKGQREKEVDVGGALGQRGGVATVEGR
ncbi:MAG: hypothetical protein M1830_005681 [Pleopsidium flavum]|nr:MAG: hypothetical protein M1830_005681 [Pleopsidium flavum]